MTLLSGEGGASGLKATRTSAGSENVRETQPRYIVNTSATRSTISRCQALSSISRTPLREMFSSQSALTWRPKGKVTSVGKVAS